MTPLSVLPLVVVAGALGAYVGGKLSRRIDRRLDRIATALFGDLIERDADRESRIRSAYIETSYRSYAAKTLLFAALALVAGAVAGAYLLAGVLAVFDAIVRALAGLPRTITTAVGIRSDFTLVLSDRSWWTIVLGGGGLAGIAAGAVAYLARWQLPASDAVVRQRGIDEGMTRTTAFMYALSRGGMAFPQILALLAAQRRVYGEPARELSVAAREMELFGRDMVTALRRMARRTPSDQFKTFAENLSSVLQSGSDLPTFLNAQYERFRDEAEQRQQEVLELLATIAEAYVTVFVAGMLFFLTILLVFGLTVADTLLFVQLLVYAIIPLANAGFALFVAQQLDALGIARRSGGDVLSTLTAETPVPAEPPVERRRADGGALAGEDRDAENRRLLAYHDRLAWLKRTIRNPGRALLRQPTRVLWVLGPIAALGVIVRLPSTLAADEITVRVLDDLLIQSVLLVVGGYAIVRYLYKRRIDRLEAAAPELFERLGSLNEAGMSVVQGFDRVRGGDLDALGPEVDRIWRDIEYGANVDDALVRFGRRVRTTAITRVVTLVTNAMRASSEIGPVLRIASEQARAEIRLRRQRRQEMLTYLIVIYVAFAVFLVIIVAVNEVLVPSLPDAVPTPEDGAGGRVGPGVDTFQQLGQVEKPAYTLVFFHAALIQGACAGFVAGQLGEGTLRDGAKHAAIMMTLAYGLFILLSSPVASLAVADTVSDGQTVTVEGASLSEGGFVAVYDEEGLEGELLGVSEYLAKGAHSDIAIELDGELEGTDVRIVPHLDTNGDKRFGFDTAAPEGRDRPYDTVSEGGELGVTVRLDSQD